ncbi:Reticulon-domain-containing protein [Blyttiomyces helicus]|uniref:Reticulon-like protein n=1 Tax=Blyttiomyces helicus TaxID=388810 RepID=A0A4P9WK63_9FUNG|nr:Reticulon-domain-containing protein [Blyttiomyces helicus]|eukprot:RKO93194.1 Reticulon-domain-containing protein [Blyttiomyces helicus]
MEGKRLFQSNRRKSHARSASASASGSIHPVPPVKDPKKPVVTEQIRSILLWQSPASSSISLAALLASVYVFAFLPVFSFLSVALAGAIALNLGLTHMWTIVAKAFVKGEHAKDPPGKWIVDRAAETTVISHEVGRKWGERSVDIINGGTCVVAGVLSGQNVWRSFQALLALLATNVAVRVMSATSLAVATVILAFTGPYVYYTYKAPMERWAETVTCSAQSTWKTIGSGASADAMSRKSGDGPSITAMPIKSEEAEEKLVPGGADNLPATDGDEEKKLA